MTDSPYFAFKELLGLPTSQRLGACSRCGAEPGSDNLVQFRFVGHQGALCWPCLDALAAYVEPEP